MARCDQGYLCDVCGKDVEAITESDLYLRYVMGEVSPLALPNSANATSAATRRWPSTSSIPLSSRSRCEGMFAKETLDAEFVQEQEERVTRAWRRLQEIPTLGMPIPEYPLPEVLAAWNVRQQSALRDPV